MNTSFKPIAHQHILFNLSSLGLFFLFFTGTAMAIEEPEYTITLKTEKFELRDYEPKIIAEVVVSGSMDQASNKGFRMIADFIFGNNQAQDGNAAKISMTAPVTMENQSLKASSEKISMTAPVTMAQSGEHWLVHFVMPSEYTLETLPKPNNAAVKVRQLPPAQYAVIRFSGFTGAEKVDKKTNELLDWMKEKEQKPTGRPELARYDGPMTLPFMRRNEVMIKYN